MIYWQDAPRKFRSQGFGAAGTAGTVWYEGTQPADFSGDGRMELVVMAPVGRISPLRTKFIPDGEWPEVYRLRDW